MIATEGVITVVPGTDIRAKRYSARELVPMLQRADAHQIGAAGYWYVAVDSYAQKLKDFAATKVQTVAQATGADKGLIGLVAKTLGIPHWVAVALLGGSLLILAGGAAGALRNIGKQ